MKIERGCGVRLPGALYLVTPLSPYGGISAWDCLLDPVVEYMGPFFRGVQPAPDKLTSAYMTDSDVLLIDCVSCGDYPSHASFFEEVRLFGLSRRIQSTYDFSHLKGKKVWLGLIHPRGLPTWPGPLHMLRSAGKLEFCRCGFPLDDHEHRPSCVYWSWPLCFQSHSQFANGEFDQHLRVKMPSFEFDPLGVLVHGDYEDQHAAAMVLPKIMDYRMGVFAIFPIAGIEAIEYVPENSNVGECDLTVNVVDE